MKILKKAVSLLLVFALVNALCVPTFAATEKSVRLTTAMEVLSKFGVPTDEIENISFQGEELSFNIRSERFEVKTLQDGKTEIIVTEDGKKDVLVFGEYGNMELINGKTLEQTVSTTVFTADITVNDIMPRNSETDYVVQCPYGNPSDYSDYQYTETYGEMVFEQTIRKYTTAGLAAILSGCLTWLIAGASAAYWASVGASMCFTFADDILGGTVDGRVISHHADYYWRPNGHSVPNIGGLRYVDKIVNHFEDGNGGYSVSVNYKVKNFY